MHDEHQQFRPWGTVTPDFWESRQAPASGAVTNEAVQPAEAILPQQAPPTEDAEAEAAPVAGAAVPAMQQSAVSSSSTPAKEGPPAAYLERINSVVATFGRPADREGLAAATTEAEKLDREFTTRYGQQHPHTINIREIRGWLALLTGQPTVAARWYLHTTGLQIARHGATHADTEGSVRRAIHTWQQVKDPAEVVQIGGDLAKVATAVLGEGSEGARFIQARVARYQQPPQ